MNLDYTVSFCGGSSMEKKYQIFISSTYDDLKKERRKVQDTILSMYHFPIGMEMFSAADEEQWEIIQETIDSSDYYVLIIGHRYGSVIETGEYAGISYTEKEFRYALEQGIPVLAFLIDDSVPVTKDRVEQDTDKIKKLEEFKEMVKTGRTVQWWTSIEDLANKVMNSLNKQIGRGKRVGWVRADGIKLEETQAELVEMSKKIRKLEKENEELRKQITTRKPAFEFEINDGLELCFEYTAIDTEAVRREFKPIEEADITNLGISESEIDAYNQSLPSRAVLDQYIKSYMFYKSVEKNAIPFSVKITNVGNLKANDVNISIVIPENLVLISRDVVKNNKAPTKPKTLENPIDKYMKKKMGFGIIESLAKDTSLNYLSVRNGLNSDLIYIPASVPNPVSNIYHNEEIEDNCLNIWDKSIIHTGEEKSEQYYLVPMKSGEYLIKISVICEEMEEKIVQDFVVKVN